MDFWASLDKLVSENEIVIDRKKNSAHPKYPDYIYPLDYGYLKGTTSGDGKGIDVWLGSEGGKKISACLIISDALKKEAEIKILVGCTKEDQELIEEFHNIGNMTALLILR